MIVGKALKENGLRDQMVLATKVHGKMGDGPNEMGNSRYHIIKACEDSLRRLQTDHIDLYQFHRPSLMLPQDETLRAFDDLVKSGKVRYIGCSTHPAWMVMESLAISEQYHLARYISEQPPYNLLDRRIENELVLWHRDTVWRFCPGHRWQVEFWQAAILWTARSLKVRGLLVRVKHSEIG